MTITEIRSAELTIPPPRTITNVTEEITNVTNNNTNISNNNYNVDSGDRPGDAPALFTEEALIGQPDALDLLPDAAVAIDSDGSVARFTAPTIVTTRKAFRVEPDRTYRVRVVVRRRVNPIDPAGDAVQIAIRWLLSTKAGVVGGGGTTILEEIDDLTTGTGRHVTDVTVGLSGTVDFTAPAGTVYARPFVQTYGTPNTVDVEVISWTDLTDTITFSPDLTALTADVAALISLDAGTRLDALEAYVSGSEIATYKSRTIAAAATIGATVDVVRVLAYDVDGDKGGASYLRVVSEPSHLGKFQSADGAWWEISELEFRPEMYGAKGDGSTDDIVALQAALDAAEDGILRLSSTYLISDSLMWTKPAKIIGSGGRPDGAVIIADPGMADTKDIVMMVPTDITDRGRLIQWIISDVMITGSSEPAIYVGDIPQTPGGRDGFSINFPADDDNIFVALFLMQNCTITGVWRRAFSNEAAGTDSELNSPLQIHIDRCYLQSGPLVSGVDRVVSLGHTADSTIISRCKITGYGRGIYTKPESGAAEQCFNNNNITTVGCGIYIDCSVGGSQVKVINNQLEQPITFVGASEDAMMYVIGGSGVDIIGNNISCAANVNAAIRLVTGTHHTVIENNQISLQGDRFHLVLDADAGTYNNFGGGNRFYTDGVIGNPRISDATGVAGPNRATGLFGRTEYASTPVSTSGTLTSATGVVIYHMFGQVAFVYVQVIITTNGTGAGAIRTPLPFTVANSLTCYLSGREINVAGKTLTGECIGSDCFIRNVDLTYPGVSGAVLELTGIVFLD